MNCREDIEISWKNKFTEGGNLVPGAPQMAHDEWVVLSNQNLRSRFPNLLNCTASQLRSQIDSTSCGFCAGDRGQCLWAPTCSPNQTMIGKEICRVQRRGWITMAARCAQQRRPAQEEDGCCCFWHAPSEKHVVPEDLVQMEDSVSLSSSGAVVSVPSSPPPSRGGSHQNGVAFQSTNQPGSRRSCTDASGRVPFVTFWSAIWITWRHDLTKETQRRVRAKWCWMPPDAALSSRWASALPHARTVVQSPHDVCGATQRLPRRREQPQQAATTHTNQGPQHVQSQCQCWKYLLALVWSWSVRGLVMSPGSDSTKTCVYACVVSTSSSYCARFAGLRKGTYISSPAQPVSTRSQRGCPSGEATGGTPLNGKELGSARIVAARL